MAQLIVPRVVFPLLLFLLPLLVASNTVSSLKSLHFTLYEQETVNKTAFLIVNGVTGATTSPTTTPFGTIFAFRDPLTATPDPSSKVMGFAEGVSVTSTFDGLWSVTAGKVTLSLKKHKGTISLLGGTLNTETADTPVVGGTDDFLFVQGYARISPIELGGLHVVYKLQFHLYWPPFAAQITH
ncbi:hypothetical protein ACLOJK_002409 [Asimina triloba]